MSILSIAVSNAVKKSHDALDAYVASAEKSGLQLSAFAKAYANVMVVLCNQEKSALKKAKTPEQVKTVKQARYDAYVKYRDAIDAKLKLHYESGLLKKGTVTTARSRAITDATKGIEGWALPKSQSSEAVKKDNFRKAQQPANKGKANPAKGKTATPSVVKATASGLHLVYLENIESAYDHTHTHFREDIRNEVVALQAAFLKNLKGLMTKNFTKPTK